MVWNPPNERALVMDIDCDIDSSNRFIDWYVRVRTARVVFKVAVVACDFNSFASEFESAKSPGTCSVHDTAQTNVANSRFGA